MSIGDEDYVSLYTQTTGVVREDLKLPDENEDDKELSDKIRSAVEEGKSIYATVLASMGIEKIIEFQEKN